MKKKQVGTFLLGTFFGITLSAAVLGAPMLAEAADMQAQVSSLRFPVYVNGKNIQLDDALIKDGKTYVQLRDLCEKVNMRVDWNDPRYQDMYPAGGPFPKGINLTNPTFVYTDRVTDFDDTDNMIDCVEITGIYWKYRDDGKLKYAFGDGLVIRENGTETVIPLDYNPLYGRMYLPIQEFKEKVQPYLTDMCMQ